MKIFKKCTKCEVYKHKDDFEEYKPGKKRSQCKPCRRKINKAGYFNRTAKRCWDCNQLKFKKDFKEFTHICRKCFYNNSPEARKARQAVASKKHKKRLADSYVKCLIKQSSKLEYDQITPEMIEGYRNVIKIKRELAKLNKNRK
jgi:acetyl-CoA carboxylase beta subunit